MSEQRKKLFESMYGVEAKIENIAMHYCKTPPRTEINKDGSTDYEGVVSWIRMEFGFSWEEIRKAVNDAKNAIQTTPNAILADAFIKGLKTPLAETTDEQEQT